jgi:membrane-bound lytic murein transglycosylase D
VTREQQALDRTIQAAPRRAEEYMPYVVRRGETLTGLAARFRTTPDVLRQLNRLQTDAIQAGQRLRVPKVAPDNAPPPTPEL